MRFGIALGSFGTSGRDTTPKILFVSWRRRTFPCHLVILVQQTFMVIQFGIDSSSIALRHSQQLAL